MATLSLFCLLAFISVAAVVGILLRFIWDASKNVSRFPFCFVFFMAVLNIQRQVESFLLHFRHF